DGRRFRATRLGNNPDVDFGLVKINEAENLPVAAIGDSSTLRPGQWILATGYPLGRRAGLPAIVRIGRVLPRRWSGRRSGEPRQLVTDAPLLIGYYGGTLYDQKHRVLAIH